VIASKRSARNYALQGCALLSLSGLVAACSTAIPQDVVQTSAQAEEIVTALIVKGGGPLWEARSAVRVQNGKEDYWSVDLYKVGDQVFIPGMNFITMDIDARTGKVLHHEHLYI